MNGQQGEDEEATFVTDDKSVLGKGKLDETDKQMLEEAKSGKGIRIINKEQLMALAKALSDTFDYYREQVGKLMTKEQAEFVRKIRVDEGYSWRAVARACYNQNWKGWERWEPLSSQPMGMALCEKAAQFFGEDYKQEPWN